MCIRDSSKPRRWRSCGIQPTRSDSKGFSATTEFVPSGLDAVPDQLGRGCHAFTDGLSGFVGGASDTLCLGESSACFHDLFVTFSPCFGTEEVTKSEAKYQTKSKSHRLSLRTTPDSTVVLSLPDPG